MGQIMSVMGRGKNRTIYCQFISPLRGHFENVTGYFQAIFGLWLIDPWNF
jgi:hypothetical protein